jgi:hypothetical protein
LAVLDIGVKIYKHIFKFSQLVSKVSNFHSQNLKNLKICKISQQLVNLCLGIKNSNLLIKTSNHHQISQVRHRGVTLKVVATSAIDDT